MKLSHERMLEKVLTFPNGSTAIFNYQKFKTDDLIRGPFILYEDTMIPKMS